MNKLLLFLLVFVLSFQTKAQTVSFNNPSFEGTAPGSSVSPPNWVGCGGSPDTQPGCWGVTLAASHLGSYAGLVYWTSIPGSQESIGQTLGSPLVSGTNYSVSMRLVNLDIFNGSWNGSCAVRMYGGSSSCTFTQLLWDSGFFVNSTWQTFTANFTPTSNWSNILFRVEAGSGTWPSVGIDNLQSAVVLPVTLSKFDAVLAGNEVQLSWETSKEDNVKHYVIQRSTDGLDFSDLQSIPAAGNTEMAHSYSAIDASLREGNLFYRLKMVDSDGAESHSEIRPLVYVSDNNEAILLDIYPNPVQTEARIEMVSAENISGILNISDVQGKIIFSQSINLEKGSNSMLVPVAQWGSGLYFVECKTANSSSVKKLVVAE